MDRATPWSYSKLSLFKKCPFAFKLRYIDKIPTDFGPAAARGSMIHQKLELFVSGKNNDLLSGGRETHSTAINANVLPFIEDLRRKYSTYPGTIGLEYDAKFDETWKLTGQDKFYWGRCIFDLVDTRDHVIMDYKTGSQYPTHESQAKYYALAYYRITSTLPRVFFIYVDSAIGTEFIFTPEDLDKCEQEIRELIENINLAEEFSKCRSSACSWCDFKKKGLCV